MNRETGIPGALADHAPPPFGLSEVEALYFLDAEKEKASTSAARTEFLDRTKNSRPTTRVPQPPRNGFTLVEVLVALVVTALLLTIVMDGAIGARARARLSAEKREAILLASNLLTEASAAPYAEGRRTGRENGLGWEVTERPAQSDPRHQFVLSAIEVKVTGDRGATLFAVGTRRLKSVPLS